MKTTLRSLALAAVLAALPAAADIVEVTVTSRVLVHERKMPTVHVHINERILGFRLALKRSDGKDVEIKGGGKPGQTRDLELVQPEGKFTYAGELSVNLPNGATSSMPLEFETDLVSPLRMTMEKTDLDLAGRKGRFKLNRPAAKADIEVMMDTGKPAMKGEVTYNQEAPGTYLEFSWPEKPGKVIKISVKPYDTSQQFTGVEWFPWQIDIPHEEVQFDSGKHDIRESETEKLDKSYVLIREAIEKYGWLADIKLYVAGNTDTVGAKDYNRTLSLNRARSIGSYFRKKGIKIPILYDGFGEEALRVLTPDETAEQGNRRADYTISIENPIPANGTVKPNWQKL